MPRPEAERFWEKVQRGSSEQCWEWQAQICADGYGRFERGSKRDGSKRPWLAHRVAYELAHGEAPAGKQVNHSCDNPRCVNPKHLHLGNHATNAREMVERGRHRPPGLKGSKCGQAKLDESQVTAARAARAGGEKIRVLARQYGVSQRAMQFALRGRNWRHL